MYNYHSNYDGDDDDNNDDDDDDDGNDDKELRLPRTEISQAHGIPPPTKAECLQQYKTNIGGYSMVAVHGILPATKMRHGVFSDCDQLTAQYSTVVCSGRNSSTDQSRVFAASNARTLSCKFLQAVQHQVF